MLEQKEPLSVFTEVTTHPVDKNAPDFSKIKGRVKLFGEEVEVKTSAEEIPKSINKQFGESSKNGALTKAAVNF